MRKTPKIFPSPQLDLLLSPPSNSSPPLATHESDAPRSSSVGFPFPSLPSSFDQFDMPPPPPPSRGGGVSRNLSPFRHDDPFFPLSSANDGGTKLNTEKKRRPYYIKRSNSWRADNGKQKERGRGRTARYISTENGTQNVKDLFFLCTLFRPTINMKQFGPSLTLPVYLQACPHPCLLAGVWPESRFSSCD